MELIAHTRPAYIDDKELLAFEREDMKRRSKLHEKVEKETKGNDDSTFGVDGMSTPPTGPWLKDVDAGFSFEDFLTAKAFIDAVSPLCEAQLNTTLNCISAGATP